MKVILLGTGGYFPTSVRQTACVLLPEAGIVFDAGSGMYRLGRHLATDRLDIFLTHAHLDHIIGLTYLLTVVPQDVQSRTTVHGEPPKLEAIRQHLFDTTIFPVAPAFQFQTLQSPCQLATGATLTHFPLQHPGGSVGYRLHWPDRSLAYVTDTTATAAASYIDHIRGVDLLLHECYFNSDDNDWPTITGHSSLLRVAELAAAAQVKRLVLMHVDPNAPGDSHFDVAAAQRIFANTELAHDEQTLDF